MRSINSLIAFIKEDYKCRDQFFRDSKEENMLTNLSTLKFVSVAALVIILLFVWKTR